MSKFGYMCLIGRPNVGKSTLTNHLLKTPIAIESAKPQTTWYEVKGVLSTKGAQIVISDTPGIHDMIHRQQNQTMNRIAYSAVSSADIICHLITPPTWTAKDQYIHEFLQPMNKHKILVINQIDRFKPHELLPFIAKLQEQSCYQAVLSTSAKHGTNCDILLEEITNALPQNSPMFNKKHIHDHSVAFLTQEMIREQLMQQLQSEMPYTTHIEIFHVVQKDKILEVHVNLHVKHIGQKKILIGQDGTRIKEIGQTARKRLQIILKKRIMLKVWVKLSQKVTEPSNIEQ
ncbi:GTPase Era [Candidatus Synchoanobacter obligatus]|uniref:GTPase Era n=1 Tax=Candidatus Synchoanobacter obligatus TaxID=2919597 RepID=A0ABT1L4M9_9GAMM|nr:GTPase Era [Candidatus Synchoanobacter obligatus]MCP8352132.1 GTPase Era [Candidatus Synchoanobacter obligatus]